MRVLVELDKNIIANHIDGEQAVNGRRNAAEGREMDTLKRGAEHGSCEKQHIPAIGRG